MSRRARRGSDGIRDLFPVVRGAILGGIAYVFGYIVTFLLTILSSPRSFSNNSLDLLNISTTDVVGWLFYNTHFVNVEATVSAAGETESQSANILSESSDLVIPEPFWYAIPICILIATGFVIAMTISQTHKTGAATSAGAMAFVGYLPVSIAGVFIFNTKVLFFTLGPDKIMGILLAGLIYPIALGALGGLLASLIATGNSSSRGPRSAPGRMR